MKPKPKPYTEKQLQFISENRALPRAELAEAYNRRFKHKRSTNAIREACARNGWRTGRTGWLAVAKLECRANALAR